RLRLAHRHPALRRTPPPGPPRLSALDELRAACAAPLPHPDAAQMDQFARLALAWVVRHLSTLADQPVGRAASRSELDALLRRPRSRTSSSTGSRTGSATPRRRREC